MAEFSFNEFWSELYGVFNNLLLDEGMAEGSHFVFCGNSFNKNNGNPDNQAIGIDEAYMLEVFKENREQFNDIKSLFSGARAVQYQEQYYISKDDLVENIRNLPENDILSIDSFINHFFECKLYSKFHSQDLRFASAFELAFSDDKLGGGEFVVNDKFEGEFRDKSWGNYKMLHNSILKITKKNGVISSEQIREIIEKEEIDREKFPELLELIKKSFDLAPETTFMPEITTEPTTEQSTSTAISIAGFVTTLSSTVVAGVTSAANALISGSTSENLITNGNDTLLETTTTETSTTFASEEIDGPKVIAGTPSIPATVGALVSVAVVGAVVGAYYKNDAFRNFCRTALSACLSCFNFPWDRGYDSQSPAADNANNVGEEEGVMLNMSDDNIV